MTASPAKAGRPPTIPGPDPGTRRPGTELPPGACDCHAHVFGPQDGSPFLPGAAHIPPDALPQHFAGMPRTIGCRRAVLVQPSVYGTDNGCMVAAMESGIFAFRRVAVIEETIGDAALEALHPAGVRGVRIDAASKTPGLTLEQAPRLAAMRRRRKRPPARRAGSGGARRTGRAP